MFKNQKWARVGTRFGEKKIKSEIYRNPDFGTNPEVGTGDEFKIQNAKKIYFSSDRRCDDVATSISKTAFVKTKTRGSVMRSSVLMAQQRRSAYFLVEV